MKINKIIECLQQVDENLDVQITFDFEYNMCSECHDRDCETYGCWYANDERCVLTNEIITLWDINKGNVIECFDVKREEET